MRTTLPFVALLCFMTTGVCLGQDRPNLLLIVADDMGYGDLSCYGSLQIKTPHLDRLAANGVRFTNGYVSSSVCSPSRAGLMTGRYGSRFGYEHNLHSPEHLQPEYIGIPLDEPLMSERLKTLGYRTGLIGKWHLGESVPGHHPNQRGFDYFFGMLNGSHQYWPTSTKNHLWRNDQKIDQIVTPYLTDWFTLEARDFIRDGAADKEGPWFLFLSYNTPHSPMQAKDDDIARYAHIKDEKRRIYCAMQHCLDWNIGTIVEELKASGQLENTLIAFISDNGGSVEVSHAVNAPLRGGKGTFLEGGIRVPTIYHWPAVLSPGVYQHPVTALDLMATFVAAAGGVPPEPGVRQTREGINPKKGPIYDSVNLIPFLIGERSGTPHQILFWRMALRGSAVREGSWKLLRANNLLPQLFNLADDVGETNNLINTEAEIAMDLLAKLNTWEASLERNPIVISTPNWSSYNRRLYERKYSLTQPSPDHDVDIWSVRNNLLQPK